MCNYRWSFVGICRGISIPCVYSVMDRGDGGREGMDYYRVDDIRRLESYKGIYWRLSFWRHLCLAVSLTAVGHIAKYPYDASLHNHPLCPVSWGKRVAEEEDGITGFSWCGLL